ncbi:MAG: hypothetical protein AAB912_00200, partial [Patescibacteria group bacterium]
LFCGRVNRIPAQGHARLGRRNGGFSQAKAVGARPRPPTDGVLRLCEAAEAGPPLAEASS